jgi:hypothetical protein
VSLFDKLEKKDWYLLTPGIVLGFIAAVLGQLGIIGLSVEQILTYLMVVPIIPGIYFLYKARSLWGGDIARYLDFIGVGLLVNLVLFPIHMNWHFASQEATAQFLAWGISPNFWYVFFHGLTGYSFAMLAYGFYLFYESGAN